MSRFLLVMQNLLTNLLHFLILKYPIINMPFCLSHPTIKILPFLLTNEIPPLLPKLVLIIGELLSLKLSSERIQHNSSLKLLGLNEFVFLEDSLDGFLSIALVKPLVL